MSTGGCIKDAHDKGHRRGAIICRHQRSIGPYGIVLPLVLLYLNVVIVLLWGLLFFSMHQVPSLILKLPNIPKIITMSCIF